MTFLFDLLSHSGVQSKVFFADEFCGQTQFSGKDPVGHLHLIKKGRVVMEHDDGNHFVIDKPTLVMYPRPYRHRLVVSASSADLICATLSFHPLAHNLMAKVLPDVVSIPLEELKDLQTTLDLLMMEASKDEDGKQEIMNRLCDILLIQSIRHMQKNGRIPTKTMIQLSDKKLANVLAAIDSAPSRLWSIEEMAGIALMSRSNFAKHFHAAMGMTPGEYLAQARMSLAESLLKQTRSVKSTARAIGYGSPSAFSKAFASHFGIAPMKWLAQSES